MLRILLATQRPEALHSFMETLSSIPEVRLDRAASGAEALSAVRASSPHLVIVDCELPDVKPIDLITQLLTIDAMVGSAVLSPLSEREFHEAFEGLGVLCRLPMEPDGNDALELSAKLKKVLGQTG